MPTDSGVDEYPGCRYLDAETITWVPVIRVCFLTR
ncbi:hypothetical protein QE392_002152 [Microbacterium proteolyticum]|nr:hypothetical protein [Microbacterium sp. SORGH_AS_0344]MDQ1170348.1 hypothetical protein [Microbacterium proteolyticum]